MYKTINFTIEELVHPQILKDIGENNSWLRLDQNCLKDLQNIRDGWYGIHKSGIYINRINIGIDSRGLRPPDDEDGSFYSVHKQGKAFDLEPVNGKHQELYNFIYTLIQRGMLKSINTLEDFNYTKTWVHIASMNTNESPLIIKP